MCLVYQLYEPIITSSSKKYSSFESLKEAEDIFSRESMLSNNNWDKFKTDEVTSTFEDQIDEIFVCVILETEKLLEMRRIKALYRFQIRLERLEQNRILRK